MFEAKSHKRLSGRGRGAPWTNRGPLLFLLVVLIGYSPVGSAGFDAESCVQVKDALTVQLNRKFKSSDKSGLADRRKNINHLAQSVSNPCAAMLLYMLGGRRHSDPAFRELLGAKLAAPAIRQISDILNNKFCCAGNDIEDWGREFVSDDERTAYVGNFFDEYFDVDDVDIDGTANRSADPDTQCMQDHDRLTAQLSRKFRSTDKKGLADRRRKLNKLFENTSRECAYLLLYWLGNEKHGDPALQKLFYGKLASPTRKQLRDILIRKTREPFPETVHDGTSNSISSNIIEKTEKHA